jgi:hypothetical protein
MSSGVAARIRVTAHRCAASSIALAQRARPGMFQLLDGDARSRKIFCKPERRIVGLIMRSFASIAKAASVKHVSQNRIKGHRAEKAQRHPGRVPNAARSYRLRS